MVIHLQNPRSYSHERLKEQVRKDFSNMVERLRINAGLTEDRAWEIATAGGVDAIADKLAEYDRPEQGARDVCRDLLCAVDQRVRKEAAR